MLVSMLLVLPVTGVLFISSGITNKIFGFNNYSPILGEKVLSLIISIISFLLSLIIWIIYDYSCNLFQFVREKEKASYPDLYTGIDGLSIYFVLLTTLITSIALLSNWISIKVSQRTYLIIMLLLETLLLAVFLILDTLSFYIFFESILPPLFILIGLFGSNDRVRASFYLFLYTLAGSLFLLLAILSISSLMATNDYDSLFKTIFDFDIQNFLFIGIFIAFAVKTPLIFLNIWLLKAHVESPLGGSILLAGIVLKLSLYGVFRLILPLLPKISLIYTWIVFLVGVITIIYASLSTIRTLDIKELIAYSSVCHAAVYLIGAFSNSLIGIEGSILLGLAHGFVSPGLFICAGGILYDRTHTRLISYYRGMAQVMPVFSLLFFILCLGNMGTPLTINFIGEFMSLYGVFERLPLLGALASTSIVFSAAYTIFMFNRICFGGAYSSYFSVNFSDLNRREFFMLLILVLLTVVFGVYPAPILDGLHYSVSTLIYSFNSDYVSLFIPLIFISKKYKFTLNNNNKVRTKKTLQEISSNISLVVWGQN